MRSIYYLLSIFLTTILLVNTQITNWWIYDSYDHDELFNQKNPSLDKFLSDQGICMYAPVGSCNSVNSELESSPPFDNTCCKINTKSSFSGCLTIFSGKYHNTNLYSLDKNNEGFSYDCDGKGNKYFDSSKFSPTEKWEITIKEKLDCIYSKTEDTCKSMAKSFKQNTKCCWFTNDEYSSLASCFGLSEITDDEFNRTTPYLTLASASKGGEMEFRCYDKSDKVIKGKYNLKYYIAEMGSAQEKLQQELLSDDSLYILSKKQNFFGIKEYDKDLTNSFQIWTISPDGVTKKFTVSVKFSYTITDSRLRNLETKTEEKIAHCSIEDIDTSSNLNLTTSRCDFDNDEGYKAEKIEIQPGHDLIGNFDDDELKAATPGTKNDDKIDEIKNKLKNASYFNFKEAVTNVDSNTIEGDTTADRKKVEFVLYHTKTNGDSIQNIKATADFLKDSKSISFTTEPAIDFKEGITIIPNQLAKSEDGEYLYIQNKIGKRENSSPNNNGNNDYDNYQNYTSYHKKSSSGLSTGGILAIVIPCGVVALGALVAALVAAKSSRPPTNLQPVNPNSGYSVNIHK